MRAAGTPLASSALPTVFCCPATCDSVFASRTSSGGGSAWDCCDDDGAASAASSCSSRSAHSARELHTASGALSRVASSTTCNPSSSCSDGINASPSNGGAGGGPHTRCSPASSACPTRSSSLSRSLSGRASRPDVAACVLEGVVPWRPAPAGPRSTSAPGITPGPFGQTPLAAVARAQPAASCAAAPAAAAAALASGALRTDTAAAAAQPTRTAAAAPEPAGVGAEQVRDSNPRMRLGCAPPASPAPCAPPQPPPTQPHYLPAHRTPAAGGAAAAVAAQRSVCTREITPVECEQAAGRASGRHGPTARPKHGAPRVRFATPSVFDSEEDLHETPRARWAAHAVPAHPSCSLSPCSCSSTSAACGQQQQQQQPHRRRQLQSVQEEEKPLPQLEAPCVPCVDPADAFVATMMAEPFQAECRADEQRRRKQAHWPREEHGAEAAAAAAAATRPVWPRDVGLWEGGGMGVGAGSAVLNGLMHLMGFAVPIAPLGWSLARVQERVWQLR